MFTYTAITLFAILSQAVMGSPIEKRATNTVIRSGRNGQCLSLPSGVQPANGVGLITRDCKTATRWDISPGSGSVIVTGTNFALDAGVPQGNNMYAKVWQSYPGSQQQTWFLTADNRIAVTGGNQCLDEGDNGPQTYQCTNGNTNQVWYVDGATAPPTSSSASASVSASASASKSSSASASPSASQPSTSGKQLKFANGNNLCAVVLGNAGDGTPVTMANCDSSASNQRFTYLSSGLIQYQGTNFCLDAGSNPANGVNMKLWTCYPGLAQQTFNARDRLLATANNQCLDVDNANSSRLQTWTCSSGDVQQQFSF